MHGSGASEADVGAAARNILRKSNPLPTLQIVRKLRRSKSRDFTASYQLDWPIECDPLMLLAQPPAASERPSRAQAPTTSSSPSAAQPERFPL